MFNPSKMKGGAYVDERSHNDPFKLDINSISQNNISYITASGFDISDLVNQNTYDIEQLSVTKSTIIQTSTNIITDTQSLGEREYIKASTLASYQVKHVLKSTIISTYDNIQEVYCTIEHQYISSLIDYHNKSTMLNMSLMSYYSSLSDLILHSTMAGVSDLFITVHVLPELQNQVLAKESYIDYTNRKIHSLQTETIPENYADISTLSSLVNELSSNIAYSTLIMYQINSSIKGNSTIIGNYRSTQEGYTKMFVSSQAQVALLNGVYTGNLKAKNLALANYTQASTFVIMNSTETLMNIVTSLISEQNRGENVGYEVSALGYPSDANLNTIFSTLSTLFEIQKKKYEDATKYVNSFNFQSGGGYLDIANIYDDLIMSTTSQYEKIKYEKVEVLFNLRKEESHRDYLLKTRLSDSNIRAQMDRDMNTYNSSFTGLNRDISQESQVIYSLIGQLNLATSQYSEYNTYIEAYNTRKTDIEKMIESNMELIANTRLQLKDHTDTIANINSGNFKSLTTISGSLQLLYQNASVYDQYSKEVSENLSSLYGYDYNNMAGMLTVISTQLTVDLTLKDLTSANNNILVIKTTGELRTDVIAEISSISTKRYYIDHFLPLFNQLYDYISNEYLIKKWYVSIRRVYEQQSYYKIVPKNTVESITILDPDRFNTIKLLYDSAITSVNSLIDAKKLYVSTIFKPQLEFILADVIDTAQFTYLNSLTAYDDTNDNVHIIPAILPFSVSYIYVPIRTNLLMAGSVLPEKTIETCVSTTSNSVLNAPDVKLRSTFNSPTTTLDTRSCGVRGRYIKISKEDNDLEIMQVIVIDKTGKNVAFGKKSTITPILLQTKYTVNLNYITNGNYSSKAFMSMVESMNSRFYTRYMFVSPSVEGVGLPHSKIVTIDLEATYEITAIQYLKFMNEYTSTGIQFSIADEAHNVISTQRLSLNTEKEILNFTDDLQTICPIEIIPYRNGTCGVLARFVRIYASISAPSVSEANPPVLVPTQQMTTGVIQYPTTTTTTVPMTTTAIRYPTIQMIYFNPITYTTRAGQYRLHNIHTNLVWENDKTSFQTFTNLVWQNSFQSEIPGLFDKSSDYNQRDQAKIFNNNTGYEVKINFNMIWQSPNSLWALAFKIYDSNNSLKNTIATSIGNPQTINQDITLLNNQYFTITWTNISSSIGTNTDGDIQITFTIKESPLLTSISPTTTAPTTTARTTTTVLKPYKFIFSQLAVIDSNRNNIAVNKMVRFFTNQPTAVPPFLTNNTLYKALPLSKSYISPTFVNNETYIEIDLGAEHDITAVHIYNTSDINNYYKDGLNLEIKLYTEDKLLSTTAPVIGNHRKEIVSFIAKNVDSNCSVEPLWPSYYGVAGIITRYVRLIQTATGGFGFSKVEIIDKNGRDIGLFKPVTATSNQSKAYLGVSNRRNAVSSSACYVASSTTTIQSYIIDLQSEYEICAVNVYGCTDVPNLTKNINIDFFRELGTPLLTYSLQGSQQVESFDSRYNPEDSKYPIELIEEASVIKYGVFGTMCSKVKIPFIVPITDIHASVVESIGQNLFKSENISYSSGTTIVSFGYMADITSVTMSYDSTKLSNTIELIDCNENKVADEIIISFSINNEIMYADFRNSIRSVYAPLRPLSIRYGPLNKGIMTQYIRVIPRDTVTPLYISQIIAVDSNGRNVTFEATTFTIDSSVSSKANYAIDKRYEAKLTDSDWESLYFEKYRQKIASESFVSNPGPQENNFLLIDLGVPYELNSIIYICSSGYKKEAQGVIIQLMDSNLNIQGVQVVSPLARQFGVDILDFRKNRLESYLNPNASLEIIQRIPQSGTTNCGKLVKFIRIQQLSGSQPIQLSQLIAIDSNGFNVALYKPTFSTSNNMMSHKIVDGSYYKRPANLGFVSNASSLEYIEVNLTEELEIVNIYAINLTTDPNNNFRNLQFIFLNKEYDVIMIQNTPSDLNNGLAVNEANPSITSFSNYPEITKIGVSMQSMLMSVKSDLGFASAFVSAGQTIPNIPTITNQRTNTVCATDLSLAPRFVRGQNNGVPTKIIRIYNPNQYVQISQIMAYTANGTNVALRKPCTATSVLPGLYVSRITDGDEGFFHSSRPESKSYVSALKRYNFVDIDLESTHEIVGVKYVPPNTNYYRNVGLSIQLLSADQIFLAQYVITHNTANGVLIDFRYPVGIPKSITQVVMPSIYTFNMSGTTLTPNGITEDSNGTIYYIDTHSGSVKNNTGTIINNSLKYPSGITCDGTNLYVADYGNNLVKKIVIATSVISTVPLTGIINPYAIYCKSGILYCSEYKMNGRIFVYTIATNTHTILTSTYNYPTSIIVNNNSNILIASEYNKIIYSLSSTSGTAVSSSYIGFNLPISISLRSPSSLAYDDSTNTLFISDYAQNLIYLIDKTQTVNIIAGSGMAGYSGDGSQAIYATLNKPISLYYSKVRGYLFISDYNNNKIRYINFNSIPTLPVQSTTTYDPPSYYRTTTLTATDITINVESVPTTINNTDTYTVLTEPSSIQTIYTTRPSLITSFVYYNNNIYFAVNYRVFIYNIETKDLTNLIGTGISQYFFTTTNTDELERPSFGKITCMVIKNNILYMCDYDYSMIYAYNLETSEFTRILGSYPNTGWRGDGYLALETTLLNPTFIAFDNNNLLYVSDSGNHCIRYVNGINKVKTIVGIGGRRGTTLYTANVESTGISLSNPSGLLFDNNNNLIFCDSEINAIYNVNTELRMTLICGGGSTSLTSIVSESVAPLTLSLNKPYGIAIDTNDTLYVTSYNTHQIFKIVKDPLYLTLSVSIIIGVNAISGGFNPNDLYSRHATLNSPSLIQILPNESFYFIDSLNMMIRYVLPATYDKYNRNIETILPYGALSVIANMSENTFNTSAILGLEESNSFLNNFASSSICVDLIGNIYVCNTARNNILRIDTNGNVTLFIDGLSNPRGISIYNNSILYISNNGTNSIVSVPIINPVLTTLLTITDPQKNAIYNAGYLFITQSSLTQITIYSIKQNNTTVVALELIPQAISTDLYGNVYISFGDRIQKYNVTYSSSSVNFGTPLVFTSGLGMCTGITYFNNNLYYSSSSLKVVYYKNINDIGSTGTIIAGTTNVSLLPVNGTYANTTTLYNPLNVCIDDNGTLYILDSKPVSGSTIYKIPSYTFLRNNFAYVITGSTKSSTTSINNLLVYLAVYGDIRGACFGSDKSIYISDYKNHYIWKLTTRGYAIIYAGTGSAGSSGLNGLATLAKLNQPTGITMTTDGILYICETGNNRVTKIINDLNISLVAGNGNTGSTVLNSTIATSVAITGPISVILDIYNNIYISANSGQIYIINSQGIINTYIGGGSSLPANGLSPRNILLSQPGQLALNSSNELHFVNTGTHHVLKLSSLGQIAVVAGNGVLGYSPNSTLATSASLSSPKGIIIDTNDILYISDSGNNIVRKIISGRLHTIAGSGQLTTLASTVSQLNINGSGQNINGSGQLPLQINITQPGQLAMDQNNRLLITQIEVPQLTIIPFTNSNSCGMLGRYLQIEGQGLGKHINILKIVIYNSVGNPINPVNTTALTNKASVQNIFQSSNTTPYISATAGLNEYVLIDLGSSMVISFINIISQSSDAIGMRCMLLNSERNIINQTITSSLIVSSTGEYIMFRSIDATNECIIPASLPASYLNVFNSIPYVRYIKIRGNGSTPVTIEISQIVVLNRFALNVSLGATVTAHSNTHTASNIVDGFYSPKNLTYKSNTSANEFVMVDLGSNTDVIFIFLYLGLNNKTNNNGLLVDLLDSTSRIIQTRKLQNIVNNPSLHYISIDFKKFNKYNLPELNPVIVSQTYKLQTAVATAPSVTYIKQPIRYIRIYATLDALPISLSQIYVRSTNDGSNLAYGIHPTVHPTILTPIDYDLNLLTNGTFKNTVNPIIVTSDKNTTYVQIDLGLDYFISDVYIYKTRTLDTLFNIKTYKSDGTEIIISPPPLNTSNIIPIGYQYPVTSIHNLNPQLGTQNVRYIKYRNAGTQRIQISQLIVIDRNGVNVAYNKPVTALSGSPNSITNGTDNTTSSPYISSTTGINEYVQIDLGSEYEIILVKFWNSNSNQNYATGSSIIISNSKQVQMGLYTLIGGTPSETADFRFQTGGPFTTLRYARTAVTDPHLTEVIRARYVRIQNPGLLLTNKVPSSNEPTVMFSQVVVYDIFGINIASGKPARALSSLSNNVYFPISNDLSFKKVEDSFRSSAVPGDWWEVDLGDNHSISSVKIYGGISVVISTMQIQYLNPDNIHSNELWHQNMISLVTSSSLFNIRGNNFRNNTANTMIIKFQMTWVSSNSGWGLIFKTYNSHNTLIKITSTPITNPQSINENITLLTNQYFTVSWILTASYTSHTIPIPITFTIEYQDPVVVTDVPVTFYNNYREEVSRNFVTLTTASITNIPPRPLAIREINPVSATRSGIAARHIRIENKNYRTGSVNQATGTNAPIIIRQLVVIDARGINVAVGKATRNSNFGNNAVSQSYGAVNGTFDSTYTSPGTTSEWWEVDLGETYDIHSIIYYGSLTVPTMDMRMYLLDSHRYMEGYKRITSNYHKFDYGSLSLPVAVQNYGKKARYVILEKASVFKICQVAVIDCLGCNVAKNKYITTTSTSAEIGKIINGNLTASVNNFVEIFSLTIDLGEEYYITNVIGYSYPRINSSALIDETMNFNTSLIGVNVILKNAYEVEVARQTFTNKCCSNNVTRYVASNIATSPHAPPFGNTTQYCPNRMTDQGSYLASNSNGLVDINSYCNTCPDGTVYNGTNGCFRCDSGFTYDTGQGQCIENDRFKADKFLTDPETLRTEFTASMLTKRFATTKNIVNDQSDWSVQRSLLDNLFFNANNTVRQITNVTSDFIKYVGNQVINTWTFTFSDTKLTIPGSDAVTSAASLAIRKNTATLWDTSPLGRSLETRTAVDSSERIITGPNTVTDINTIIPAQYRDTNYYTMEYDSSTAEYYYTDIPMISYLRNNSGATYCESLDFTEYSIPTLPPRRTPVYTNLTPDQKQSYLGGKTWTTAPVTTPLPYPLDPNTTKRIMTETDFNGITRTVRIPTKIRTFGKTYHFTSVGSYKFTGSSIVGNDRGRFGLNFITGDLVPPNIFSQTIMPPATSLSRGAYSNVAGRDNYFIYPQYKDGGYSLLLWWSWYTNQMTVRNSFDPDIRFLSPKWANYFMSGANRSTWHTSTLNFSVFSITDSGQYNNIAKYYYHLYIKRFTTSNKAEEIPRTFPYIEFSSQSFDGNYTFRDNLTNLINSKGIYNIPAMVIVMVGQTSGNTLKFIAYSNKWYWREIANLQKSDNTYYLSLTERDYMNGTGKILGPYFQNNGNSFRLPLLDEFMNILDVKGFRLGETYNVYCALETADIAPTGNLWDIGYLIDYTSTSTYGIEYY